MLGDEFISVAVAFNIIGTSSYVLDTLRGRNKPNRITWLLCAPGPLVAFAAEVKGGAGFQALMTLTAGIGPLAVFIASFVNSSAYWKLTRFDITCGLLSIIALAAWLTSSSPSVGVV